MATARPKTFSGPEGTAAEYARIHYAARKAIGAKPCERCGVVDGIQAALRHDANAVSLRIDPDTGCLYSIDTADYHPLCVPCHRRLDLVEGRDACPAGHDYTPENTSVKPDGARRCLTCHREQEQARLADPEARAKKNASLREYSRAHPLTPEQRARKTELQRARRAAARAAGKVQPPKGTAA